MKSFIHYRFKPFFYRLAHKYFPVFFNQLQHYRLHKMYGSFTYCLNLKTPKTFNEKIITAKISNVHETLNYLVDKETVKVWVREKIGQEYLVKTIGVFCSVDEINFNSIEYPCIFKPTHASGKVLILSEKPKTEEQKDLLKKMGVWLKINHFFLSGEPQYKNLKPKIICEELLGNKNKRINDYKFFCFHGVPRYIQVDLDRDQGHKRNIYDPDWNKMPFTIKYPSANQLIPRPKNFNKMLDVAKKLSEGFDFVRVDLYNIDGAIYFGEMTFHHGSGYEPFTTYEDDLLFGSLI